MLLATRSPTAALRSRRCGRDDSEVHHSRQFGELLIPELLGSNATVGEAVTRAKQELAKTNPAARDMILGWTILGDPALTMGRD